MSLEANLFALYHVKNIRNVMGIHIKFFNNSRIKELNKYTGGAAAQPEPADPAAGTEDDENVAEYAVNPLEIQAAIKSPDNRVKIRTLFESIFFNGPPRSEQRKIRLYDIVRFNKVIDGVTVGLLSNSILNKMLKLVN